MSPPSSADLNFCPWGRGATAPSPNFFVLAETLHNRVQTLIVEINYVTMKLAGIPDVVVVHYLEILPLNITYITQTIMHGKHTPL